MDSHDSPPLCPLALFPLALFPLAPGPQPQYAALTISRRRFLQGATGVGVFCLAPITLATAPPSRQLICLSSDANIIVLADRPSSG